MIKSLKQTALQTLRGVGAYGAVSRSKWRRSRLLVLCYHGISLEEEHRWNWGLYIDPEQFERRMRFLRDNGYQILSLSEGLERVRRGDLPDRSVAITFDDGMYDFYVQAMPVIRKYELPVTVYLTTYYSDYNRPIFRMACSYMLWRCRAQTYDPRGFAGLTEAIDLRNPERRMETMYALDRYAKTADLTGRDKDALLAELALKLGFDYSDITGKRILHVMNEREVREVAAAGVDVQLHTHRHRTPRHHELFAREIADNSARIVELTGNKPVHFCYPSGVHHPEFAGWLKEQGVESATTCDAGFVTADSDWYLLPRMLDHAGVDDLEFEGWLTGLRALLPKRKVVALDPDTVGGATG